MPEHQDSLPDLPDALVEALRKDDLATVLVPREVDEALLGRARAQFASREASGRRRRWLSAAAAASVVVAALMTVTFRLVTPPPLTHPDDIDGSGQVDVLDAFALARRHEAETDPAAQARADALVARIVSLSPPSRGPES